MKRSCLALRRAFFARALAVAAVVCGQVHAESFSAGSLQGRETGPFIAGQTSPAPSGGWSAGDDRALNASVDGQGGWRAITFATRYDQEIATGVAHSGGHSWRLSNWYHTGLVNPILSPQFAATGESGASNNDGPGNTTLLAQSAHVVHEFWFRSASVTADPGSFISTTISDAPGNRMTYLGIFDEVPGPGTGGVNGNGCPDDNGCFHVDAVDIISGDDSAGDGDATFADHYSAPLQRGVWYRARIDATFVNGPGALTTDPALCPALTTCHTGNDQIHYQIFDGNGNLVFDTGNVGSWEAAYFDGRYGNPVGTRVAADYIGFRVSANADTGSQQPFDTNSVTLRPRGVYLDDMSAQPDVGAGFKTSFDFDRYVAKTGTDTGNCTNPVAPCLTISYAITQSNPYDTIHVGKGIYAENSAAGQNLIIAKPVAIEGAQAGIDARTRNVGDANETILVPSLVDAGLTLNSLGDVAVVQINSSGVSLDGLTIDGDNTLLMSPVTLNGSNPDADSAIFASGSGIGVQNTVLRNLGGSGILAFMDSGAGGDNTIAHDRFINITNPSTWGIGIYAGSDFYAQIEDNLLDQVRVGIQTENNNVPNPGTQAPRVARNEIHATRNAMFHNLFYQSATAYTLADNHLLASANPAQINEWNGLVVESMQDGQTVSIHGNIIDGSALAGSGRKRVAYLLNNVVSSAASSTSIDGGSVNHVDVGVLATDASFYTGPVNDFLVTNIAFDDIAVGAFYVEDVNEQAGSARLTIGDGNIYGDSVAHRLVLSGAAPTVGFAGSATGIDDVLVRSARNDYFGALGSSFGPCNVTQCTVANAPINTGIGAANAAGTVSIEQGTFNEMALLGSGKDGLRVTAEDANNPPTLTRLGGGPNQPVFVIAGTPLGSPGPAPRNVQLDHLNFSVDKSHSAEGVLVSGFVDGLSIHDNTFVQTWSAPPAKATYGFTNAISINIDPAHNSLGTPRVDGSFVSIQNNSISGSSTPNATKFRAGIAMDAGVGTIANNVSAGLNHDAIVRFATTVPGGGNGVTISGNTFNGGGLEFDAPNFGITPIFISGNTITAAAGSPALGLTQQQLEADISVLRLIDNYQHLPVTVSGNTFGGYANGYRGALVENFPNTTFSNNTFQPLAGAGDFVSLVLSNKEINTDNPAEPPYPMTFTALANAFNGSGVNGAGRAVELLNDNDANGSASFDSISFGDSGAANANSFDAAHAFYFNMVDQNCDTRVPPGNAPQCTFLDYNDVGNLQNTQVRPFRGNVYAVNNSFGGLAPRAMSPLQQARLNQQTFDINDDVALGYVDYGLTGAVELRLQGPVANVQVGVNTAYSTGLTNTGNALSENVLVQFSISRTNGIQPGDVTLRYDAGGGNFVILPLSPCPAGLCGTFGPQPGGFPLPAAYDAITQLRSNFAVADTYTVHAAVQGVGSNVIYATDILNTRVVQTAANIDLNLEGPASAVRGAPTNGYSARLTNTGGATTENVDLDFRISRAGGIAPSDIVVQYNTGSGFQLLTLVPCGANLCGRIGGASGFPVGAGFDMSVPLRVVFAKSGVFSINGSADGVVSNGSYATSALTVIVPQTPATVMLSNLTQHYDGAPKPVTVNTAPPGLAVNVTYNGSNTVPSAVGTYTVVATITDPNYSGTASATLAITDGANVVLTAAGPPQALVPTAPYTGFVDYNGTLQNSGDPTSQAVHYLITVVRVDDHNAPGGQIAIAPDDVQVCVNDPSGAQADNKGCPASAPESLFYSEGSSSLNGRPAVTFRYPINPANDAPLPTIANAIALPPTKFRFKPGEYAVQVQIVGANNIAIYATATSGTSVPNASIAYNGATSGPAEQALLSTTTLGNSGGRVAIGNVIVRITLSDTGGATLMPSDADFAYQVGAGYQVLPWTQSADALVTYFGPPGGFALPDGYNATTAGQSTFHREGSYTLLLEVLDAATLTPLYASQTITPITIGANQVNFDVSDLAQVYDGTPRAVTVAATPANATYSVRYAALGGPSCPATPAPGATTTPPTNAGSYCVYVDATGNFAGSASGTLVVAKAQAGVSIDGAVSGVVTRGYNGAAQVVTATATAAPAPTGSVSVTYNGDTSAPSAAGSYALQAVLNDPNYVGGASGNLVINDGTVSILLDAPTLGATYDGSAHAVTATTTPAGVSYAVSYVGDTVNYPLTATAPTEAGQYHVVATTTDANYSPVQASGTLVISQASAAISLDGAVAGTITRTYNATAQVVTATTSPAGLQHAVVYVDAGNQTLAGPPMNVGTYTVGATIGNPNHTPAQAVATLVIQAQTGAITFDRTSFVYNAAPQSPLASMAGDSNISCGYAYVDSSSSPLPGAPTNAGSYSVTATCTGTNQSASASTAFVIARAQGSIAFGTVAYGYDGTLHTVSATLTQEASALCTLTGPGANGQANAGLYAVNADCSGVNWLASASTMLSIAPAPVTILLSNLGPFTYDGTAKIPLANVTGEFAADPAPATFGYVPGGTNAPVNAGSYTVTAVINDSNYSATPVSGTLVINPAGASATITNTAQVYDGTPKSVSVSTNPAGLTVNVTYDGSSTAPSAVGSYSVVASVVDANYAGSSAAVLQILSSGTAANITANSATTFGGTAGSPASPAPSVKVTDTNGNPVPGYGVTFVTGGNSGTLFGATQTTDANGIATVGGWTLGTAATQTVSVTDANLNGSPVTFTANVTAHVDVAVNITDNHNFTQFGDTLDYVIVVSNSGPSTANNTVTDNLPPELDFASSTWMCFSHTTGATCAASGSGDLSDTPSIPSGGSVTYVLTAAVRSDAAIPNETVLNQVSVTATDDADTSNNAATSTTVIVIFRDGFEAGSNGAQVE